MDGISPPGKRRQACCMELGPESFYRSVITPTAGGPPLLIKCDRFGVIVGAMKCGTTSLFRYLSEHPEIAPCRLKSPNFFSDDEIWTRGLSWYQKQFDFDPSLHRWGLEASTAYSKMPYEPDCSARMASTGCTFKILYLVRNPIRRIESHFTMGEAKRWQPAPEATASVKQKLIDLSSYAMQIEPYFQRFSAENVLIIRFERLRDDAASVMREVCGFLGIDSSYQFPRLEAVHMASAGMTRWPDWFASMRKWPAARRIWDLLPARRRLAESLFRMKLVKPVRLTPAQEQQVWEALSSDVIELRTRYGVDVSDWQVPGAGQAKI